MTHTKLGIGSRVRHEELGVGIVIQATTEGYNLTFVNHGRRFIAFGDPKLEVIEALESPADMVSMADVQQMLAGLLEQYAAITEIVEIGEKWRGGTMILQPADKSKAAKEIPIETFFHKIVMVRDRLRVMEQRINSSQLDDEDKVSLEQYITRIYGSLTSFNVLFRNKEDYFVGAKS